MSDKTTQFVEHYGEDTKYKTPMEWALDSWTYGFRFAPKGFPAGAMSKSVVADARAAVSTANKAKIEAEKNFLLSHGFQVVIDYSKEIVRWRAPDGYGNPTSMYEREAAVGLVIDAINAAKEHAKDEVKRLSALHGLGDCANETKKCGGGK